MAELALGIAGIALAWKGILDFGKLISTILDDDTHQRDMLAISLECSQQMLRDWGEHWGIDRKDGRYVAFDDSRKALISIIITRLHESRLKAIKRLEERYGITYSQRNFETAGKNTGKPPEIRKEIKQVPGKKTSKMIDKVVDVARRGKEKSTWLMHDRNMLLDLVRETKQLHDDLNAITSFSVKFVGSNLATQQDVETIHSSLQRLVEHARRDLKTPLDYSTSTSAGEDNERALAGLVSKTISSSEQAERIQNLVERSLHFHGDTRVPDHIISWWNDNTRSSVLVLEVSEQRADETSTAAAVLLYSMIDCDKLIFVFNPDARESMADQVSDMLHQFVQELVVLGSSENTSEISMGLEMKDIEAKRREPLVLQRLVDAFHHLFGRVLEGNRQFTIIIDGLDLESGDSGDEMVQIARLIISGLHRLCITVESGSGGMLKVLVGHKGHAVSLYDCVGDADVVDLTDRATRETSFREELALMLQLS